MEAWTFLTVMSGLLDPQRKSMQSLGFTNPCACIPALSNQKCGVHVAESHALLSSTWLIFLQLHC